MNEMKSAYAAKKEMWMNLVLVAVFWNSSNCVAVE